MVRQHHSTAAYADGAGRRCYVSNQYRRRGAGKSGNGVMFRQPIALVAQLLYVLCQIHRAGNCVARTLTGPHAHEIQNRNSQSHMRLDEEAEKAIQWPPDLMTTARLHVCQGLG
jgi:hypothetical protein